MSRDYFLKKCPDIRKKNKGITLVALVITIIILLILAGISISALTNTGIFQKAVDAKNASENAEKKQNEILAEYEKEMDQHGDNTLVSNFNSGKIKVGDYVSYKPDTASTDKILEELGTYSGTTANTSEKLTQELDLKWRILDVKDGKVRLISAEPTTSKITLLGAKGYNNAVYLLDKVCNTLYNNTKLASKVKNIKIEDIQQHVIYDYKLYSNENVDTKKYGGTKEYKDNRNYPKIFAKEKTGWVDGEQGKELSCSEQQQAINETKVQANLSIKITQTCWYKTMEESDFSNPIYFKMLINNNGKNYKGYWLSSRCINANSTSTDFDVVSVYDGSVSILNLCSSGDYEGSRTSTFRPIITLNSSVQLDKENLGDGTLNTPFNIK